MSTLSLDLETRSALDLTKVGAYRYFEHPSTEILLGSYAIDDGPVRRWRAGEHVPAEVMFHVEQGGLIAGWNVSFERLAWSARLATVHDWPLPTFEQFHDTAALAAAMALPRALEDCADALNLAVGKDLEGSQLMKKMARPRKARKGEDKDQIYWFEDDERMSRLAQYCDRDVEVEREIRRRLFRLSSFERDVWLLDQKINDRGIQIDLELMRAMDALARDEQDRLDEALAEVTGGAVGKCSQVPTLTKWLCDHGVVVPSLKHQTFDDLLAQPMPPPCRAALLLRQESAKSSTKKLNAAKRATGSDGRMRGTLLYHGASTGRWSGKLLQPQNLPRPAMVKNILPVVELIRHGNAELIRFLYGNVLTPLSDCLRGLIVAAPGHELLSFDYSNIEARLTAWFAGDTDKLVRFAEIDANPDMPDMYRVAAAGIYNVHPDDIPKSDPRRQVGKVAELALGFGGGVSALLQMAANYHIDMAAALPPLLDTATAERVDQVTERWEQTLKRKNDKGIPRDAWVAAELAKRAWRDANPKIVEAWHLADGAAWEAVGEPGKTVGNEIPLRFLRKNGFLWMQLPSGRPLAYGDPRVRDVEVPWSDKTVAKPARETKRAVTVMSTERPKGGMPGFIRYPLYPGLEIQHAVQATARDLLAAGMLRVDQAGYRLVLSVHDEALAEERTGARDIDDFTALMCALPGWAHGLPVVGDAWRGPRYHKHD